MIIINYLDPPIVLLSLSILSIISSKVGTSFTSSLVVAFDGIGDIRMTQVHSSKSVLQVAVEPSKVFLEISHSNF